MLKGVIVAYAVIALCYLPVALVGYYIFVVVHLIGSYQTNLTSTTYYKDYLCCFYNVYCSHIPFLQRPSCFFWRICVCANYILSSMYHMAYHLGSWFCIIFGVSLTIVGPIGGLREITIKANTYQFY
ncbi:hypothetical protein AAHA92_14009 [Salvia divinorum]|uniref:Uncharacterized protein n=1 Tax=Salvia divinorum TaxID=28513 RepID=A0ABD1HA57_SALDI